MFVFAACFRFAAFRCHAGLLTPFDTVSMLLWRFLLLRHAAMPPLMPH
jgi:hypothetical protein